MLEAPLRDREAARVQREIVLDVRELHVREVVRLDRALEARVQLLDLAEHALGLRLFRLNGISGGRNSGRSTQRYQRDDQCRRLTSSRARGGRAARQAPSWEGPGRHKHGTLTSPSDSRKLK